MRLTLLLGLHVSYSIWLAISVLRRLSAYREPDERLSLIPKKADRYRYGVVIPHPSVATTETDMWRPTGLIIEEEVISNP